MMQLHDMTREQLDALLEEDHQEYGMFDLDAIHEALRWVCTKCGKPGADTVADRYGIYYGTLCEPCEKASGIRDFVFDASYAGEHLEEEDY